MERCTRSGLGITYLEFLGDFIAVQVVIVVVTEGGTSDGVDVPIVSLSSCEYFFENGSISSALSFLENHIIKRPSALFLMNINT